VTDEQLSAIEQRAAAATPGPWASASDSETGALPIICGVTQYGEVQYLIDDVATLRDAAFIAHAREDVPALCAEVRRLRDLVAELEEMKAVAVRVDQSWRRNYCDCVNERDAAEDEAKKLLANIERLGHERDQMIAANVELQERLSAFSALEDDLK